MPLTLVSVAFIITKIWRQATTWKIKYTLELPKVTKANLDLLISKKENSAKHQQNFIAKQRYIHVLINIWDWHLKQNNIISFVYIGGRSPSIKMILSLYLKEVIEMAEIELNTKIFRKDNLDIVYSVTGKKHLNGILHYKLKSENSEEIFLS